MQKGRSFQRCVLPALSGRSYASNCMTGFDPEGTFEANSTIDGNEVSWPKICFLFATVLPIFVFSFVYFELSFGTRNPQDRHQIFFRQLSGFPINPIFII